MNKCKCCRKAYGDEYDGVFVRGKGVVTMGYGSRHDGNQYQFTLVPGWYCYNKKWFGKSAVVDERGAPLVVYHGTGKGFHSFDTSPKSTHTGNVTAVWGSFFTPSKGEAERYVHDFHGGKGRIVAAYLSMQNPYRMTRGEWDKFAMLVFRKAATQSQAEDAAREYREELVRRGHDGIIVVGRGFNAEYIAFHPAQIKSISNDGTWDADDPDIRSNPTIASNPHQLLPEPDVIADLKKIAQLFWDGRKDATDAPRGGILVALPGGQRRHVPIIAFYGKLPWNAVYDIALKEIVVCMGQIKSATSLYYDLLHEAIHAGEFLTQPQMAQAQLGRLQAGYEPVGGTDAEVLEYYLRQTEINAYTIVFIQMASDLLSAVDAFGLRGDELAVALRDAAAGSGNVVDAARRVLQSAVDKLRRTELVDAIDKYLKHGYLDVYGDTKRRDDAWATFDLQRSFANKLWYAMEEWKARNTYAAKKGRKR